MTFLGQARFVAVFWLKSNSKELLNFVAPSIIAAQKSESNKIRQLQYKSPSRHLNLTGIDGDYNCVNGKPNSARYLFTILFFYLFGNLVMVLTRKFYKHSEKINSQQKSLDFLKSRVQFLYESLRLKFEFDGKKYEMRKILLAQEEIYRVITSFHLTKARFCGQVTFNYLSRSIINFAQNMDRDLVLTEA